MICLCRGTAGRGVSLTTDFFIFMITLMKNPDLRSFGNFVSLYISFTYLLFRSLYNVSIYQNPNRNAHRITQHIAPKKHFAQYQTADNGVPDIVDPRRLVQLAKLYRIAKQQAGNHNK